MPSSRGQITGAYVADIGTAMPESLTEPLGSEWSEVHELFDFGTATPGSLGTSKAGGQVPSGRVSSVTCRATRHRCRRVCSQNA